MARCSSKVCEAEQIYDNSCQLGFPGGGIISLAVGLCETKKEQERKNGRKIKEAGKKGEQENDGKGGA